MRQLPQQMPEQLTKPSLKDGWMCQVRHYTLITPLFGGGVEPQQCDPISTVRASEVRGQLRFWWRATRGGVGEERLREKEWRDEDLLADMKTREGEIWGLASEPKKPMPSQVQVEVIGHSSGSIYKPYELRQPMQPNQPKRTTVRDEDLVPGYAAFPLQPIKEQLEDTAFGDADLKQVRKNVSFMLKLTYPQHKQDDVDAALWAWETFGGIGGRTRRGFGALRREPQTESDKEHIPPTDPLTCKEWIMERLVHFKVQGVWPKHVPNLGPTMQFEIPELTGKPPEAWVWLIGRYRTFRHQRPNRWGRNRWPEPDALRSLTRWGQRYISRGKVHDHSQPLYRVNGQAVRKFPRAAFGLPIIFKFKNEDIRYGNDPPDEYSLVGSLKPKESMRKEDVVRYASPLILRPIACGDSGVALVCILAGMKLPPYLVLESLHKEVKHQLTEEEAAMIVEVGDRPGQQLLEFDSKLETNVLKAFLKWL